MPYKDPSIAAKAKARSYVRNRETILERNRNRRGEINAVNNETRASKRRRTQEFKLAAQCQEHTCRGDGGYPFEAHELDFHHTDPSTKVGSISILISSGCGWRMIEDEMAKCTVVCACCHRRLNGINPAIQALMDCKADEEDRITK